MLAHKVAQMMTTIIEEKPHEEICKLLTGLAADDTPPQPQDTRRCLQALLGILTEHFQDEENIMNAIYYPQREDHIRSHKWILGLAQSLIERTDYTDDPKDLINATLAESIERHLRKYDDKLLLAACAD